MPILFSALLWNVLSVFWVLADRWSDLSIESKLMGSGLLGLLIAFIAIHDVTRDQKEGRAWKFALAALVLFGYTSLEYLSLVR